MIQDIEPKKMNNQYRHLTPEKDSRIFCICKGRYLICHSGKGDDYPSYGELCEMPQLCIPKITFLFSIDQQNYFMYLMDEIFEFENGTWEQAGYFQKMKPKYQGFAGITANHLYIWHRDNQFCGRCGEKMIHDEKERMLYCPSCHNMVFPKIAPAVVVAVRNQDELLLTKYEAGPDQRYALVAGFVEIGETAEEAVARELMEEVGLRVKNIRYYKSQPWGLVGNLMMGYTAELDGSSEIHRDESELAVAEWIKREKIPDIQDENSLTREMIHLFQEEKLLFS